MAEALEYTGKRVTLERLDEIARWCGGSVLIVEDHDPMIKVDKYNIALLGDYIVQHGDAFEVLRDDEYKAIMSEASRNRKKLRMIFAIVTEAMTDATRATERHDTEWSFVQTAKDAATKIFELG